MEYLETVQVADSRRRKPFRLRVQWVNRPNLDFRGFCGTIASGKVRPGDEIVVTSSGQKSRVARIVTMDGELDEATAGQAVTLTLTDEIDISRGETCSLRPRFCPATPNASRPTWSGCTRSRCAPERSYLLKAGGQPLRPPRSARWSTRSTSIHWSTIRAAPLGSTRSGSAISVSSRPLSFDPYRENPAQGVSSSSTALPTPRSGPA